MHEHPPALRRAAETDELITAVRDLVVPFIRAADDAAPERARGTCPASGNVLVDALAPAELAPRLALELPDEGRGRDGLLDLVRRMLRFSVNTWDQGFLDKLYASTTPVGVVAEMLLAVLNTNLHVYQVSPALTVVEKTTARRFARLFGFAGPRAGGVTCQGGSSSNLTSLVVARNTLFPETKMAGNAGRRFALFTSAHGHYSVVKSAIACGMGEASVVAVAVDSRGCMDVAALEGAVARIRAAGMTPLYVNATAGTTVMGSYDPLEAISAVCRAHGLWMHVDASWGGPAVFSARHRHRLAGAHLADSLTVNPHKMLNVPVTCSFLLGPDTAVFHRANTLAAGYLFHGPCGGDDEAAAVDGVNGAIGAETDPLDDTNGVRRLDDALPADDQWDLADMTLQCGRRGDSLKLALAWTYYGAAGFSAQVDGAFAVAARLASLVAADPDMVLVSDSPPPCLQVCFYYAPGGALDGNHDVNTRRTRAVVARLVTRGFMVDYAPGERGSFFRVVVNCQTLVGTVEGLVGALRDVGREVVAAEKGRVVA